MNAIERKCISIFPETIQKVKDYKANFCGILLSEASLANQDQMN